MTPMPELRSNGAWNDAEILRESGRWVHVPPSGVLVEDEERFLVLLPANGGASRVWRSRPERTRAGALIRQTIEEARARGGSRLVWHTGNGVSPPFMDGLLREHGFAMNEDLEVLAFEMGTGPEPVLPRLRIPPDVQVRTIEDEAGLRRAHAIEARVFPASTPAVPDVRAYLLGLDALRRGVIPPDLASMPRAFRCLAFVRVRPAGAWETAATAGAELSDQTLRLWGAATLPELRRRGAYRALVIERCRHAHALGATLALAKANGASSAPILRAAGFRNVAAERRYTLDLGGDGRPEPREPTSTFD